MMEDYVSEDSMDQNVTDVNELLHRIELLEEDNNVLRSMMHRNVSNAHQLAQLPKERLASSHDKLQKDLVKEKDRRQTLETLRDQERRAFEQTLQQKSLEIRRAQDQTVVLRTENDNLKTRIRDMEQLLVALRKDNDHLRIENDSLRFNQRKAEKQQKDPHAPFVHRNGPVPFSQVLRALNGGKALRSGANNGATSRGASTLTTGRSVSAQQQQQDEEYRFVDPNAAAPTTATTGRGTSKNRSVSPYQQQAGATTSGSRARGHNVLEIREGARVTWQTHQGIIRYLGPVDDLAPGQWAGVELIDGTLGDHGGYFAGRQYFVCSRRTGIFCRVNELIAPRLLDQYPAENPATAGAQGSSALNSAALRSASYDTNNQAPVSNRSASANNKHRSASAHSQRSQQQPASPRRITQSEYDAINQRVSDAFNKVRACQGALPFISDQCTIPGLRGLFNLVKPTDNIQKIMSCIALALHMRLERDATENHKDMWDRTRQPQKILDRYNNGFMRRQPSQINGETAEFISNYHAETLDPQVVEKNNGFTAAQLAKFVAPLAALATAVSEWTLAQAALSNVVVVEEEKTEEQQEEAALDETAAPAPAVASEEQQQQADEPEKKGEEEPQPQQEGEKAKEESDVEDKVSNIDKADDDANEQDKSQVDDAPAPAPATVEEEKKEEAAPVVEEEEKKQQDEQQLVEEEQKKEEAPEQQQQPEAEEKKAETEQPAEASSSSPEAPTTETVEPEKKEEQQAPATTSTTEEQQQQPAVVEEEKKEEEQQQQQEQKQEEAAAPAPAASEEKKEEEQPAEEKKAEEAAPAPVEEKKKEEKPAESA